MNPLLSPSDAILQFNSFFFRPLKTLNLKVIKMTTTATINALATGQNSIIAFQKFQPLIRLDFPHSNAKLKIWNLRKMMNLGCTQVCV